MTPRQIELVQGSFAQVTPIAEQAAALFYSNLFSADASLKPLFKGDMQTQGEKLMQMIGVAVSKLNEPQVLLPVLQRLGERHADYGVEDSHYATVGGALLLTLSQGLADAFTEEVEEAWSSAYGLMASTMIEAANKVGA
ncbi:globin family protein [Pseudomonas zhanjiangensis]|uniref:Globin family protein n=1 Tax=Pseudomonas zhanjiangensis TaxID=3239015 RepID=A0ABV3YQE6_9PSED